jgi:hypothetical protein
VLRVVGAGPRRGGGRPPRGAGRPRQGRRGRAAEVRRTFLTLYLYVLHPLHPFVIGSTAVDRITARHQGGTGPAPLPPSNRIDLRCHCCRHEQSHAAAACVCCCWRKKRERNLVLVVCYRPAPNGSAEAPAREEAGQRLSSPPLLFRSLTRSGSSVIPSQAFDLLYAPFFGQGVLITAEPCCALDLGMIMSDTFNASFQRYATPFDIPLGYTTS